MDGFDWTIVIAAALLITAGLSITFVGDGRHPIPLTARVGGIGVTLLGVSSLAEVFIGTLSGTFPASLAIAVIAAVVLVAIAVSQQLHQQEMMFHAREARNVAVKTRSALHRDRLHLGHDRRQAGG